jgi:HK97 gp10 family phage protein
VASVRINTAQVDRFARRLQTASNTIENEADRVEQEWGENLASEMRSQAPVMTGELRRSIEQVEPGGIAIRAPYWRFLEYGTSRMSPQPFIRPAMKRITPPAKKDAAERAKRLISRG